jgi:hypothetical protein
LALPSETGQLLGQEVDAQVVEGMYGVVDDEESERFVVVQDGERGEQQGIALAAAQHAQAGLTAADVQSYVDAALLSDTAGVLDGAELDVGVGEHPVQCCAHLVRDGVLAALAEADLQLI